MADNLYGLRVRDFAHPDDLVAMKALKKSAALNKLISFVEDKSTRVILQTQTLGNCVRISAQSNERLYRIVRETCDVLGYNQMPEIYTFRSYNSDVIPHGVNHPVIVVPDFVVNAFDDSLLQFTVGRAVTRLMSEHLKLYVAANAINRITDYEGSIVSDTIKVPLANWMRKSELTADRGGLLATQDFHSAMKFLMIKAGMPFSQVENVDERDYIDTCMSDSKLVNASKKLQTLSNYQGWANDRVIELYLWYAKGAYDELLDEYLD